MTKKTTFSSLSLIDSKSKYIKKNQKQKMENKDINEILAYAFNHHTQLIIQIEMTDENGNYFSDTVGLITGFDHLGIFIGQTKIHYDEIRNIALFPNKKANLS